MNCADRLFSVVAVIAMTAGTAMAQLPARPEPAEPPGIEMIIQGYQRAERALKLSDDATAKLAKLREDFDAALQKQLLDAGLNLPNASRRFVPKLTPEQRGTFVEVRVKVGREFWPKAAALLSSDQLKRLKQIDFYFRLKAKAPDALLAEDVAAELKLTNDQRERLNALRSEYMAKQSEAGFNRDEYLDKAIGVLTDEQKATLERLKGEDV